MSAADLLALADRCEAATSADRELDAHIAVALGIGARGLLPDDHEYLIRARKGDDRTPGTYWFQCRSGRSLRTAESYTASLDAAMTLVEGSSEYPDCKTFVIDCATQTTVFGQPVAHVWSEKGKHTAKARTPALALVAASLRARAAMEKGE